MHFLQAINSDIGVLIVCNKTGGTIKGDIKKILYACHYTDCITPVYRFHNLRDSVPHYVYRYDFLSVNSIFCVFL